MHPVHKMRTIATDGVALSVCLSVGHLREPTIYSHMMFGTT